MKRGFFGGGTSSPRGSASAPPPEAAAADDDDVEGLELPKNRRRLPKKARALQRSHAARIAHASRRPPRGGARGSAHASGARAPRRALTRRVCGREPRSWCTHMSP
jgi:hypothetical protein